MTKKVAYIILCWNNRDLLDECIQSIEAQSYDHKKVILVDNDSRDDSVEHTRKNYPNVEILELDKNEGFAIGNNRGIDLALEDPEVEYIALINTDATLDPGWTSAILDVAKHKPKGASFQTITLDYYDHQIIDSTHIYVAHNGQATQGSWRRPILDGADVAPQKVFGCNAAAAIYTRKFIETQPYRDFLDETIWMYLEDVDVAARATVMGWDNYVVPGARAYHMGSASSGKNPGFSLYRTFRNNSGMLIKNFPFIILMMILPRLIRGDIDTVKVLWCTGHRNQIKYVVKGRLAGLIYIPIFMYKRTKLKRVVSSRRLWRLMHQGYNTN